MNYFDDPNSKHFSFESFAIGLEQNTFGVINFTGFEAISRTYDFEIMLLSSKKDIDFEEMLQSSAVFTIHRGMGDDVLYNGILAEFDQLHEVNDVVFYRARLVPKLWWLTLTHHNQVFLKQSVPDFVDDALRDGGLESADFEIAGLTGYQDIDYVCQYDESHFNFVARWLERQGIYYYFDQEADGEVLILTDTKFSHSALKQGADLFYNPASGLEGKHLGEAIGVFTSRQKQLPAEIILRDYNYERPSLDITSKATVDPKGRGVSYIYGEFFATEEEGQRLAGIRAEELLCQKQEFFGESTVPYIMPGFTFNMHNHYRDDFNQEYLILEVTHEGNQSHLMSGGIATEAGKKANQAIYRNSFKAIPNETQYRPQRVTEKPKISGTIHANIDSEVDGEYAQIDEQGRYRVRLPFDINDEHLDGKGSAPIRMMQAYAGKNRGMQFPLVKGTEVLLTFIEGNPDRPIIAGAVANAETQGPVNHNNQSESVIQTGGNNRIRMEDKIGSERMVLESPAANSWVRIGTTNDPITLHGEASIFKERTDNGLEPPDGTKVGIDDAGWVDVVIGEATDTNGEVIPVITKLSGPDSDPAVPITGSNSHYEVTETVNPNGSKTYTYKFKSDGDYRFKYTSQNSAGSSEDTAIRRVYIGLDGLNQDNSKGDGIRIRTAGVYWNEGKSRVGDFIGGPLPDDAAKRAYSHTSATHTDPEQIGNLLANFADGGSYRPTGLLSRYKADDTENSEPVPLDMDIAIQNAHVTVSSMDVFNTQEGNIYDFGGYWNYDMGNSYGEEHIDQKPVLNRQYTHYWKEDDADATASVVGGAGEGAAVMFAIVTPLAAAVAAHAGSSGGAVATGFTITAQSILAGAIGALWGTAGGCMFSSSGENFQGNIGDVIEGPDSGTIKTWAYEKGVGVGSSFIGATDDGSLPDGTFDKTGEDNDYRVQDRDPQKCTGPMHTSTTAVSKQFGDSYGFTRGNEISIRIGNTEEHHHGDSHEFVYGGIHEETKFNGDGRKVGWERGGGGKKSEANWHQLNGTLLNFEHREGSWFTYEHNFVTIPTLKITTSASTLQGELNISAGACKIELEAATGINMKFGLTAGLDVEIVRKLGGAVELDEITLEASFKSFGLKARQKAALEADNKTLVLEQAALDLKTRGLLVDDGALDLSTKKLKVNSGALDVSV